MVVAGGSPRIASRRTDAMVCARFRSFLFAPINAAAKHECDACGGAFLSKSALEAHKTSHNGGFHCVLDAFMSMRSPALRRVPPYVQGREQASNSQSMVMMCPRSRYLLQTACVQILSCASLAAGARTASRCTGCTQLRRNKPGASVGRFMVTKFNRR